MNTLTNIADKLDTILKSAFTGTKTNIHTAFYLPIESDTLPAIVIYPKSDSTIETFEDDTSHRSATFTIEIRAIGLPPLTIIKPTLDKVLKTIFTDTTLGGISTFIQLTSQTFDGAVLDKEYSAAAVELEIGYMFSPTAQG